jgi:hypothetical protein
MPRTTRTYADVLSELRIIRQQLKDRDKLEKRRDKLVGEAQTFPEARGGVIATAAGISAARVSQIAPKKEWKSGIAAAQSAGVLGEKTPRVRKSPPAKNPVADAIAAAVGKTPAPAPAEPAIPGDWAAAGVLPGITDESVVRVSASVSKRLWHPQAGRVTAVAHSDGRMAYRGKGYKVNPGGGSAAEWLAVLPADVERLILVGPRPWHTSGAATMTSDVRRWLAAPTPGWEPDRRGGRAHLVHEWNPSARYRQGERRVEIRHAAEWIGEDADGDCSPLDVFHAFGLLRKGLRDRWGTGVELLATPAQTGKDLWSRTIPKDREYPVMSYELRQLISATSGQGRAELRTPPAVPETIPALHVYDGTFMYAGLLWGMPVGEPMRVAGPAFEAADDKTRETWLRGRSRWHVKVTVPAEWWHVGILPAPVAGSRDWEYPAEPGRTFTTWAGGPEVWLARKHGWHVEVLDGIRWAEGKPLDLWKERLLDLWQAYGAMDALAAPDYQRSARMARKMVRALVLHTIGSFNSRGRKSGDVVPVDQAESIPAGAKVYASEDGTALEWSTDSYGSVDPQYAHPEWAAEIWSRARTRLLEGPGGTGVLSGLLSGKPLLDPSEVVAFRTDAVYLTRQVPWSNEDDVPGRFRRKGSAVPFRGMRAPGSLTELLGMVR